MNGIKALEELKNAEFFVDDDSVCGCTCYYPLQNEDYEENFDIIERELKVNQILKEKQVEIDLITIHIHCNFSIDHLTEIYNKNIGSSYQQLTVEEMRLIVDWLKEE